MAYLLSKSREYIGPGQFIEIGVSEVPESRAFPEGVKYSMSFVRNGKCILRYDNERTKGGHMHFMDIESTIDFTSINKIKEEFKERAKKLGGEYHEVERRNNQDSIPR